MLIISICHRNGLDQPVILPSQGRCRTYLFPLGNRDVHQLVNSFLESERIHQGQVDGSSQVDKISLCHILDAFLLRRNWRRGTMSETDTMCYPIEYSPSSSSSSSEPSSLPLSSSESPPRISSLISAYFSSFWRNFGSSLKTSARNGESVGKPNNISQRDARLTEGILNLQLIIQGNSVCDLLVLFYQIESFGDNWVILELVPPDLEQNLDHILNPLVDRPFM
jgi:hypothetical protein